MHSYNRISRILLFTLPLFFFLQIFNSCSTVKELARIQRPELAIEQIRLTDMDFQSLSLAVDVRVNNPNQIAAELAGYNYNMQINDQSFLRGEQDTEQRIEAGAESIVTIPLSFSFQQLYNTYHSLQNQDSSKYQIQSSLKFDLPVVGLTEIPVETSGYLPMIKTPKLNVRGLNLKDLSFTSASLNLNIEVENPNGFDLLLNNLKYQFEVNEKEWASGIKQETLTIADKSTSQITIPIKLDFMGIGQTVYQLLSGNEDVVYAFSANLNLTSTAIPLLENIPLPLATSGVLHIQR
ncbi:MAG: LEA type 2 family protein [Calditrichia bacterium]